jgi:hypothetical protein
MDPAELYKPPRSDLNAPPSAASGLALEGKLYSIRQITAGTFLGGPLAGTMLMAANFREMGRVSTARNTLVGGVAASILVSLLAVILVDRFPSSALPVAYVLSLRAFANSVQGPQLAGHFSAGGGRQSNWRVLGIALACMAGLLVAVVVVSLIVTAVTGPIE